MLQSTTKVTMNQTRVDIARHKIQPLSSTNYSVWSKKMKLLLRGKGLWTIVSGIERPPPETDSSAFLLYTQRKDVALTDIILSIEDKCSHAVINLDDPHLVWEKLQEMYEGVSDACIDTYLERLQNMKMEEDEKVMEYMNRLVEIENDLAGVGHILDEKDKIRSLLRGLREEFEAGKVIRAMEISFTKAVSELVIEEGCRNQLKEASEDTVGTALTTVHQSGTPCCSHCGREGHIADQCFHNPKSPAYRKTFRSKNSKKQD